METRTSKPAYMEKDNLTRKNNAAHKAHVRSIKESQQASYFADEYDDDELDEYSIKFEPVKDED
jgi:hypothetical protein